MFDQWLFFRFNLREETGFVSTSIDNRQPLESLNMSEVPLNNWESQIQMSIHFALLNETKYYNIGICYLSALRHNMTGRLWHMIMCQSGHDWMAMTYDHVSEWMTSLLSQTQHDWMAMTYDHVSEWMTSLLFFQWDNTIQNLIWSDKLTFVLMTVQLLTVWLLAVEIVTAVPLIITCWLFGFGL